MPGRTGCACLLDRGVYFEFVPVAEAGGPEAGPHPAAHPVAHGVGEVETGVEYAVVVSTAAGLWRFSLGDTVAFVSRRPPRIRITGRLGLTLSAFGEHVIGAELERAVAEAAGAAALAVRDFAVGSLHSTRAGERGGHLYLVEFAGGEPPPARVDRFLSRVDAVLQRLNDDYAAHRAEGWGLDAPRIEIVPPGGFAAWMKQRGKLGGQNKVPRVLADARLLAGLRAAARERRSPPQG